MGLTQETVKELLEYRPDTGVFIWKKRNRRFFKSDWAMKVWNKRFANKEAGHISPEGYRIIAIFGSPRKSHRLAWLYMYGELPAKHLDHINQDKTDNRIKNLRLADAALNARNCVRSKANTSGVTGVYWKKKDKHWQSSIKAFGEYVYLGSFHHFEDAVAARKAAEKKYGFHKNHGNAA